MDEAPGESLGIVAVATQHQEVPLRKVGSELRTARSWYGFLRRVSYPARREIPIVEHRQLHNWVIHNVTQADALAVNISMSTSQSAKWPTIESVPWGDTETTKTYRKKVQGDTISISSSSGYLIPFGWWNMTTWSIREPLGSKLRDCQMSRRACQV